MSEKTTIRTVYLYLFALIGLGLSMIGLVMMVNILLKTHVFKNANVTNPYSYSDTPIFLSDSYYEKEYKKVETIKAQATEIGLTEEDKESIESWLEDYKTWKEKEENRSKFEAARDYTKEQNARNMSTAISLIVIGLPIYLVHWLFITSDIKKYKENN